MNPIRKNVAHISAQERQALKNAILELNNRNYPDGVSKWYKQDAIHQATHVHGGPSFLPWHRELLNRFEKLLQEIDPNVALHYWDWTTDPRQSDNGQGGQVNLFSSDFMGSARGAAGAPFAGHLDNNGVFEGSRNQTHNQADPPQQITRALRPGTPPVNPDAFIVNSANTLQDDQQWATFRTVLEKSPNHNTIHGWIGGTIGPGHTAFEDPFVFIMHANIDRIWAMWQTAPGYSWRLDPQRTYGIESNAPSITENMQPWAGGTGTRPWTAPDNQQEAKTCLDPTVVNPPNYDTNFKTVEPVGGGGVPFADYPTFGQKITHMVINAGDVIDAIQVVYDGIEMPKHGGPGGAANHIEFAPDEHIIEVSGLHGYYFGANHILELTIKTNKRTIPTFGTGRYSSNRQPFSIKGKIIAFSGKSLRHTDGTNYISALGAIVQ